MSKLNVLHIKCLDVRIILPAPGKPGPVYWFRGSASSLENRRDAAARRDAGLAVRWMRPL